MGDGTIHDWFWAGAHLAMAAVGFVMVILGFILLAAAVVYLCFLYWMRKNDRRSATNKESRRV